jgi:hypothetical protein
MNGQESSKMLKNTFTVEVYIPKMIHGNILELMDSMCKQSEWISESKTRAANKTILMLLSIWLERNSRSQQIKKEEQLSLTAKANQYVHISKPSHC